MTTPFLRKKSGWQSKEGAIAHLFYLIEVEI